MQAVMEVPDSHELDKYVPGTRIPVLDERLLSENQPEYVLILPWDIADELTPKIRYNG